MLTTLIALISVTATQQRDLSITEELKKDTIETLLKTLVEHYIFEDLALQAEKRIKQLYEEGKYKDLNHGDYFADALMADVNSVLNDAHFMVTFSGRKLPERDSGSQPNPEEVAATKLRNTRFNGGFAVAKRLPGNIGYIEVFGFMSPDIFEEQCAAAFDFVSKTEALIIDLRRNDGGYPRSVQILCSYLFGEEPVHLNTLYFRNTNETRESWTFKELKGKRYGAERPVYVLTSENTMSAAEECAYNLQAQNRATIIGETTWGGANPGEMVRLNDHYLAFIPDGQAINPVTKTNWEGVGVKPQVLCESTDALTKGEIEALGYLIEHVKSDDYRSALEGRRNQLVSGGM